MTPPRSRLRIVEGSCIGVPHPLGEEPRTDNTVEDAVPSGGGPIAMGKPIKQVVREFGHARSHRPQGPQAESLSPAHRRRPGNGPPRCSGRSATIDRILADDEDALPPSSASTRRRRSIADSATSRGTAASMSRSSVTSRPHRRREPRAFIPLGHLPGRPRGRLRPHPRRLPRRPQARAVPGGDLGVLQRPGRAGCRRADRGRARRDGRGLRVLRGRPSRSLVG